MTQIRFSQQQVAITCLSPPIDSITFLLACCAQMTMRWADAVGITGLTQPATYQQFSSRDFLHFLGWSEWVVCMPALQAAGTAFSVLFKGGAAGVVDSIIPSLLASLEGPEKQSHQALEGLRVILGVRPQSFAAMVPKLLRPPLTRNSVHALGSLAEAAGEGSQMAPGKQRQLESSGSVCNSFLSETGLLLSKQQVLHCRLLQ